MTVFSKIEHIFIDILSSKFNKHPKKYSFSILFIIMTFLFQLIKTKRRQSILNKQTKIIIPDKLLKDLTPKKSNKGRVDGEFFRKLWDLLKIVIPSVRCPEFQDLCYLSIALYLRTVLSIYLATIKGKLVKGIIQQDFQQFLKGIMQLGLCAIPGSFINSSLNFFNRRLSLNFRKSLTDFFMGQYLDNLVYYKITNLDQRIPNPDQNLTSDIEKWANSLSTLYSNISKVIFQVQPLLDIILISKNLSAQLGWGAPLYVIGWYIISGFVQWCVSPVIGKMTASLQKLEGQYRYLQSELNKHSEEIALYDGKEWEKTKIIQAYKNYSQQEEVLIFIQNIIFSRLQMGTIDSILIKYGANVMGYFIIGIPVFGKNREEYLKQTGKEAGKITRDYVRNSSLLIDLAGAIGRLIASYKNLQLLAGYTQLVYDLKQTVSDINKSKFKRQQMNAVPPKINGQFLSSDKIIFQDVPIVTPNGETLVEKLNFEIVPGMNVLISGPNGCGKSSMFRILGQLWPLYGGQIQKPELNKMFYIPQRPYLPYGSFRDQIIYPHTYEKMIESGKNDELIIQLMQEVQIKYFLDREGGLDAIKFWNDELSQGEKQKLAMARLFYHKPDYAILDECTSNTSLDMESLLYNKCKELNITLFTVSHRQSLFKFHDYVLRFDGEGGYKLYNMEDFKL